MSNIILNSKQFAAFLATNKKGQLDAAALFALAQLENRNTQNLNKLLNLQMFRKVNGDLNKSGQELKAYVAHFKLATIQWQGDRSRFQFIDAEPTAFDVFTAVTFTAWQVAQADSKPSKETTAKPLQAKALLNNFKKLSAEGLSGNEQDMAAVLAALDEAKADILKAIASAKQSDTEITIAEHLIATTNNKGNGFAGNANISELAKTPSESATIEPQAVNS